MWYNKSARQFKKYISSSVITMVKIQALFSVSKYIYFSLKVVSQQQSLVFFGVQVFVACTLF